MPDRDNPLSLSYLPLGVLWNFFGDSMGMFTLSPVTWVGLVAVIVLTFRKPRSLDTWSVALLWGGLVAVVGSYPNARGGMCPAGRDQVAQCFVALYAVLAVLSDLHACHRTRARLLCSLLVLGVLSFVMSAWVLYRTSCWFERYHPLFKYKSLQPHYGWLPDFGRLPHFSEDWNLMIVPWILVLTGLWFIPDGVRWIRLRLAAPQGD